MPNDQSLRAHYHLLLRLDKDWEVEEVKLCSAPPLKVGQVPVMFRRLVDGVCCIG